VHGLTREHLVGAPRYPQIADVVADLLRDRVLVAHNAKFDWEFLTAEAQRANRQLPVNHRLCTMSLVRCLELPVPNLSLAGVARYVGVTQHRPHDALDDAQTAAAILKHCIDEADRIGLALPLTPCDSGAFGSPAPAPARRTPCPWRNPGRLLPGGGLTQGMKVAFTGATSQRKRSLGVSFPMGPPCSPPSHTRGIAAK
jgi:DNA polymerase-3 subunit epsilon